MPSAAESPQPQAAVICRGRRASPDRIELVLPRSQSVRGQDQPKPNGNKTSRRPTGRHKHVQETGAKLYNQLSASYTAQLSAIKNYNKRARDDASRCGVALARMPCMVSVSRLSCVRASLYNLTMHTNSSGVTISFRGFPASSDQICHRRAFHGPQRSDGQTQNRVTWTCC